MNAPEVESLVATLLARLPAEQRDDPVPLLKCAGTVERLTGERPSASALHRWADRGSRGAKLECLRVGGTRIVTPRLLCRFFVEAGQATKPAKRKSRRGAVG